MRRSRKWETTNFKPDDHPCIPQRLAGSPDPGLSTLADPHCSGAMFASRPPASATTVLSGGRPRLPRRPPASARRRGRRRRTAHRGVGGYWRARPADYARRWQVLSQRRFFRPPDPAVDRRRRRGAGMAAAGEYPLQRRSRPRAHPGRTSGRRPVSGLGNLLPGPSGGGRNLHCWRVSAGFRAVARRRVAVSRTGPLRRRRCYPGRALGFAGPAGERHTDRCGFIAGRDRQHPQGLGRVEAGG